MSKIRGLAQIFAKYKIYPKERFTSCTAAGWFLDNSNNYYAQNLKTEFLPNQNYKSQKRGADLPFWGKDYFSAKQGKRIFVIAQDSLTLDAGSIVFWAHLFENPDLYKSFKKSFNKNPESSLGYDKFIFKKCDLNLDFLYITDAKKVYQECSYKKFNNPQSKKLLNEEINFCQPNIIIFLGLAGYQLLIEKQRLVDYYRNNKKIRINGIDCFVFPFPTGNGLIWAKKYKNEVESEIKNLKNKIKIDY